MKKRLIEPAAAMASLERERSRLTAVRQKHLDKFISDVVSGQRQRMAQMFGKIRQTNDFLRTLEEISARLQPPSLNEPAEQRNRYVVSSMFLYSSFKKLTADANEQFFFVTGAEFDGARILDQWAEFAHQTRNPGRATGDIRSTHRLLIRLEQFGHRLNAHFHSHPGNGPSATQPSGIDENFQARLEAAGHGAVMAIFSRDGFIRFVRLDGRPQIEIFGTGVELHDYDTNIYRLTDIYNA